VNTLYDCRTHKVCFYLFSRIANSSDICYIGELVSIAEQYATATKQDGPTILKWHQEVHKKYAELDGIRKL